MEERRLLFFKLVFLFVGRSSAESCDRSTTAQVRAGNLGQSGDFNWLGVLHVHIHDQGQIHIAMTGIVLINMRYALANADDVVRIPQHVFESDSKAMFLVAQDTPWFAKPKSYVTHPEYEYSTLNTIAIVELDLDDAVDFPLNPICIPTGETFNTSRYLYLTGFTDENKKMEKVIYNIQYLDKKACEEFYNRAGLSSQKRIPSAYLCGYAPSNVTQCVWDNGMALVSNVTGYFHLIGFGIHGPGCAAPARFIDLFPYFSWIKSITSPDEVYDYRRKGNVNKGDDEFVPIHKLFAVNGSRRAMPVEQIHSGKYPFDIDVLEHFIIKPTEDSRAVVVIPFMDTWENIKNACESPNKALVYNEYFELKTYTGTAGIGEYKLSFYDLENAVASCVRITVDAENHSRALLSFREHFYFQEGTHFKEFLDRTPKELLQSSLGLKGEKGKVLPNFGLLEPTYLEDEDDVFVKKVLTHDLYIKFEFADRATLLFEIFAEKGPLDPNRVFPFTKPRITTTTKKTNLRRRAKSRTQTTAKSHLGMVNLADNIAKKAKVSLMADVVEVQETESAARSAGAPGAVVVACWLFSAYLRRAFFIH